MLRELQEIRPHLFHHASGHKHLFFVVVPSGRTETVLLSAKTVALLSAKTVALLSAKAVPLLPTETAPLLPTETRTLLLQVLLRKVRRLKAR
jgi:hypothetical protein